MLYNQKRCFLLCSIYLVAGFPFEEIVQSEHEVGILQNCVGIGVDLSISERLWNTQKKPYKTKQENHQQLACVCVGQELR